MRPGSCAPDQPRACVSLTGSLTVSYVHPEERGVYTCMAYNNQGNTSRDLLERLVVTELEGWLEEMERVGGVREERC